VRGNLAVLEEVRVTQGEALHARGSLRKELVDVPVGLEHDFEDTANEALGNVRMKQIAHAVHEYTAGLSPSHGILEALRPEPDGERVLLVLGRGLLRATPRVVT
jgi:hypothetical protein